MTCQSAFSQRRIKNPNTEPTIPTVDEVIRSYKLKPRPQLTAFQLEQRSRRRRALELREQGWTFEEIADELGWASASGASYAVDKARKDRRLIEREVAAEVRDMHYEQLTVALSRVWPVALGGRLPNGEVVPPSLKHMQMARAIMREKSELCGLVPSRRRRSREKAPAATATGGAAGGPIIESEWDLEQYAEAVRRASTAERDSAVHADRKPPVGYVDPRLRVGDADSEPEHAEVERSRRACTWFGQWLLRGQVLSARLGVALGEALVGWSAEAQAARLPGLPGWVSTLA